MKIAVEGCCHGELDKIYETIAFLEQKEGTKVELLLCCGDFQAVRNEGDMKCMAIPPKYRRIQDFYKYYSGEKKAPVLTIFIGGNHEASNHLQELPYGGWVAPNIYYLGYAGVVRYKGVRIGGASGIFKSYDYRRGHFEYPPYDQETLRSVYHIRNIDVFKLKQIQMPIDVFMSHDWPQGIYHYGDTENLLKKKKFLRQEVEFNTLGSPAAEELLSHLQPSFWFSAHLHVKFAAVMQHPAKGNSPPRTTKFLSLDKCLPHRDFLQIVDIPDRPGSSDDGLEYDPEWLAILKATNSLQSISRHHWNPPENNGLHEKWDFRVSEDDMMKVMEDLSGKLSVPENFSATQAAHDPANPQWNMSPSCSTNPQTTELCASLGLTDIYGVVGEGRGHEGGRGGEGRSFGEEDSGDEPSEYPTDTSALSALSSSFNPDEITLEEEWEEEEGEEVKEKEVKEKEVKGFPKPPGAGGIHTPSRLVLPEPKSLAPPPSHSTPAQARPQSQREGQSEDNIQDSSASQVLKSEDNIEDTPAGGVLKSEGSIEDSSNRVLKRNSEERVNPRSRGSAPLIKRRNQEIYAAADDEED